MIKAALNKREHLIVYSVRGLVYDYRGRKQSVTAPELWLRALHSDPQAEKVTLDLVWVF